MLKQLLFYVSLCCTLAFLLLGGKAQAQTLSVEQNFMQPGDRLLLFSIDYYKTDMVNPLGKAQLGIEAGHFFSKAFMASGGLDFWTERREPVVTLGSRYYPKAPFFIRQRALIKDRSDVSLGAGYNFLLNGRWVIETTGDYYLNGNEFAFRISFGILSPKNKKSP